MPTVGDLTAPEKLTAKHDLSSFKSGEPTLDDWLKRRALANEKSGASRTYVVCSGNRIVGYYALANGAIAHNEVTGRVRRNMPEPIPVMVIGRLAIDEAYQGHGIAAALLREAILRTSQAAEIAGIRAILVHAISDDAKKFCERSGFYVSSVNPMTLMITLADAEKALRGK
jgi:GNAT superfamily N-acetyltransferase